MLAAATVAWRTDPPAETVTWVLLRENALGPQSPPAVYVPQLNLKGHGGPRALGLRSLSAAGSGLVEVPETPHLAARVTETDVDLVRPDEDIGGFVAGYRSPVPAGDELFVGWRAAAARHGRIVVITGSAELLIGGDITYDRLWEILPTSHGAIVPLTRDSARPQADHDPSPSPAEQPADFDDRSEYSELLTAKLRSQDSFQVYMADTITRVIDPDSLQAWLTNLWPVTCQTCGEPLGTKADLAVSDFGSDTILLSMHHSACRPSGVTVVEEATLMPRPTSSFVVGYLAEPGQRAPASRPPGAGGQPLLRAARAPAGRRRQLAQRHPRRVRAARAAARLRENAAPDPADPRQPARRPADRHHYRSRTGSPVGDRPAAACLRPAAPAPRVRDLRHHQDAAHAGPARRPPGRVHRPRGPDRLGRAGDYAPAPEVGGPSPADP